MDTEKITINLGAVDLGKVDVLVDEGFYGNRTDFIRTAIRNQLTKAVSVVGLLSIGTDVSPELAREVFASVKVRGVFRAEKAVKDALSDRTQ
jgi:Arc/MetJ-type ribon-helix-helix transcriptional regulator